MNDPQLLSELSSIVNQIKREHDEAAFEFQVDTLLEKYEICPPLQRACQSLALTKDADKRMLSGLEEKAQNEIRQIYESILHHCNYNDIPLSKRLIEDYERKITVNGIEHALPIARNLTLHCFLSVRDIIQFLLQKNVLLMLIQKGAAKQHIEFISHLAKLNDKGDIIECNFSPSYDQWIQKKEDIRENVAWYCHDQLMYLKKTKRKLNPEFPFNNSKNSTLLTMQNTMLSVGQSVDLSEYRPLVVRLYEYTKQDLLNPLRDQFETLDIYYDGDTGIMTLNTYPLEFDPESIEGKLLYALTPGGILCNGPMPLDEIGAEIFDNPKMIKRDKDKIYKAQGRINTKIEEITNKKSVVFSDSKGNMLRNPEYNYQN
ncbi:MAG: hypothetical protein NTX86_05370 [Candidatus Dependentiae bacterium]|nr:hypothetical protein [Candidatus Dependentiae bacterium]